ncbi:carbonate dehydratase [Paracidovorax anthurii]|uniref:Carbonic anhydrase/acetyltransferase-like protein (Isoleucine patch superfamily) n=1 Tax=Paracidovorax anthurii TaxID=78229 RepID=A0A328ZHP6_9BURK|nr:carbonate dehydratase [Paracidovorax anthurii]RAR85379.1 carbonic anhydrase/acetyltransferase-like protein (isoleucine patch superfamily) [Paracidovorax anthurii]WCM91581.1 carbonate dehydratase [Acidovorax sp. NCPPB 2350]
MIRRNPSGDVPWVHPDAFVDPTAILCGRVIVQPRVFVGPYAVIRADDLNAQGHAEPIVIGAHSSIQDGVVIHSRSGAAVTIGERTFIALRAIVHGPCTVGDGVFIGFNSVLFNCTVASGCVVRHSAVVDGCNLPPGFHVPSTMRLGPHTDLTGIPKATETASGPLENMARSHNHWLQGYKRIQDDL